MRNVAAVVLICLNMLILSLNPASADGEKCPEPTMLQMATALTNFLKGDGPRGVEALSQVDALPNLQEDSSVKLVSSNDPTGGNIDVFNFLYRDSNGEYVILDEQGPGIIYNSWMTSLPGGGLPGGNVRFYFDGATKPAIDLATASFFDGSAAPFTQPVSFSAVVGNANKCIGCQKTYYNYYPIGFQKSLKITLQNVPGYYHFYLRKYATTQGVQTYTGKEDLDAVRQQWNNLGTDPKKQTGTFIEKAVGQLPNDSKPYVIYGKNTPGTITALMLRPDKITLDVLLNVRLQIFWDDGNSPSVDVPIGFFFGGGPSLRPFMSLMSGMPEEGLWYNYLPMPYWKNARVQLVNSSDTPLKLDYEIKYAPNQYSATKAGYLHANYTYTAKTNPGKDVPIAKIEGRGQLVGVVMSTALTGEKDSWWEGDERFYVDGSRSPQLNGTGTEDFFNMAYEPNSRWIAPLNGTVSESTSNDGKPDRDMTWYRWLLGDAINFQSSLQAGFEIGPINDISATDRRTAAFWYALPETPSQVTDTITIGDSASEQTHGYKVTGQTFRGERTLAYSGDQRVTLRPDTGVAFTGQSDFSIKVNPNAKAVLLRRRTDLGTGNQVADVYVNGQLAGRWQERGVVKGGEWFDSEFLLPTNLTRGQSKLNITVRFISSDKDWNEFSYEVLSLGARASEGSGCLTR